MPYAPSIDRPDFHLKIIQEISELVNQAQGLQSILDGVARRVATSLGLDVVSIYLWDPKKEKLVMRATRGLNPGDKPVELSPGEGLTGQVFSTRQPLAAMPASAHPSYRHVPEIGEEPFESYVGVPILLGGRCLGVLVGQTGENRPIHPADQTLFETVASRLAGLMEVADRLERLRPPKKKKNRQRAFQGKGVSPGFAVGPVFLYRGLFQEVNLDRFSFQGTGKELARAEAAFAKVEEELTRLIADLEHKAVFTRSEMAIFQAHLFIVRDKNFRQAITSRIKKKRLPAEAAVVRGVEAIVAQFEQHGSPMLKERVGDIREIGERVLHSLLSEDDEHANLAVHAPGEVVVAEDLGPAYLARLGAKPPAAVVTTRGGETSHTAILARSLGIPAVVGVQGMETALSPGQVVLVDGKTGFLFADPDKDLITQYKKSCSRQEEIRHVIEAEAAAPVDLEPFSITANVGFPVDMTLAREYNVSDVGLFRTEFTFMRFNQWPSPEEQARVYEEVGCRFPGYVTVRTLDIGADKFLPYFRFPPEENPLLGLRSIRFSMEYPDLFRDQVRAILTASTNSDGRFRILLPLVSRIWEVETARQILEEEAARLEVAGDLVPPLGIMAEVPGLVYQLEDYADLIDFVSVGTNDLIQYLLAVDRNSNLVGHLYTGHHPSVLRVLRELAAKCGRMGKEITVCGELASEPAGALALAAVGFSSFSVAPSRVPLLRYIMRRVNQDLLRRVGATILSLPREREVHRYLTQVLEEIDPILLELE
ncbi:MAG: phosphoenolpyruvate--protein phosphotransferase [Deltaproteobacteria bacterium]|nr:phosphoenolpyruvate--protein phosphotransferase [Deltaproteobacteria bacterium]